jgi:hypothetical protein
VFPSPDGSGISRYRKQGFLAVVFIIREYSEQQEGSFLKTASHLAPKRKIRGLCRYLLATTYIFSIFTVTDYNNRTLIVESFII